MGILLDLAIQPLIGRVVAPNIGPPTSLQQFQWCGAAKSKMHEFGKK
jgi:hypothetical protein